jgi:flavin reductase (DIM6/NTAB) family NADH-FMN oxidoreductase RutF
VLDCEVRQVHRFGSHSLFVGEVVDCTESDAGAGDAAGDHDHDGADVSPEEDGVLRMEDTRMNYGG